MADVTEASLLANAPLIRSNRRRLLTIGLPSLWFFAILGAFAGWRPARSPLSFAQLGDFLAIFIGDIPFYLLLVISAGVVLWWLIHPWRMRRLMQKALRAAGFETPILLRYVIEADGLTTREPQRESFTPWSHISRLDEGRDHLFFVLPSQEETVALPKRAIPAGQIDSLRGWLGQWIGVAQLLPEPPAPPDNALSFEVAMEPKDWAAHVAWYQDLPELRRSRRWGIVRNWLLASLAVPVLTIAAWALDTERLPVSLSLPIFWDLFPSFFWKPALAFGVLAALRLAFDRPLMRWFAGYSGATLYNSTSKTPNRFVVDDSGILTVKGAATTFVKWPGVIGLARQPEHWLMRISRGSTLIVPRRALDPAQSERLEALCSRHIQQA
ncbi:hypothetical protein J2Y55_002462 [Bosea sp. BE125]|uniref:YcxB family protein n=1 Tax=Bosea sp. BE125 TaxID=2817909 RepID=UPI0028594C11|nr:YcxB family protein [Bosea sp. BE125]MDR6871450.1 hypothetical protein [Bosea sp. BE125]